MPSFDSTPPWQWFVVVLRLNDRKEKQNGGQIGHCVDGNGNNRLDKEGGALFQEDKTQRVKSIVFEDF